MSRRSVVDTAAAADVGDDDWLTGCRCNDNCTSRSGQHNKLHRRRSE